MKRYRVYFNRMAEWPQIWSVDEGDSDTEVCVVGIVVKDGAYGTLQTNCDLTQDNLTSPRAWMEVTGTLVVRGGVAYIE